MVIMRARFVRDLAASPHKRDELLRRRRIVEQLDLAAVDERLKLLINIARALAAHLIADGFFLEARPMRHTAVGVGCRRSCKSRRTCERRRAD
jgi:hypothetical protein